MFKGHEISRTVESAMLEEFVVKKRGARASNCNARMDVGGDPPDTSKAFSKNANM